MTQAPMTQAESVPMATAPGASVPMAAIIWIGMAIIIYLWIYTKFLFFSFIYKMKLYFNKIYYAFSKTERWMNLTKRKGDFSWGLLLDIFEGFELGISFALASLPTFLFIRNSFEYIIVIPFVLFFCILILLRRIVNKRKWEELDRSLWKRSV